MVKIETCRWLKQSTLQNVVVIKVRALLNLSD